MLRKQEKQLVKLHLFAVRPQIGPESVFSSCFCQLTGAQADKVSPWFFRTLAKNTKASGNLCWGKGFGIGIP